jgi:hypothetical protein
VPILEPVATHFRAVLTRTYSVPALILTQEGGICKHCFNGLVVLVFGERSGERVLDIVGGKNVGGLGTRILQGSRIRESWGRGNGGASHRRWSLWFRQEPSTLRRT